MNIKTALCQRLIKYAKIKTPSNDGAGAKTPSTPCQLPFAKQLAAELKKLGCAAKVTKHAYVLGSLPANTRKKMPSIGFIAHLDTVQEFTQKEIRPQLHKNYKGGKLALGGGLFLDPKTDPLLKLAKGHDIVTTDGTTILGADDKAGIAIIMTMLEFLQNNPGFKHGPIKIAFTPDEEIGHGAALLPLKDFGADYAFTLDSSIGSACDGNFNADAATIKITGVSTHPGLAKNMMVNPLQVAAQLIEAWPQKHRAEHTNKRKGFIHFNAAQGTSEGVTLKAIVREHDLARLRALERELSALRRKLEAKNKGAKITVEYKESYRNMADQLKKKPAAMNALKRAMREENAHFEIAPARGGTDGARLTLRGLPTPDFNAGYSGEHGPFEWASLDAMALSLKVALNIVKER